MKELSIEQKAKRYDETIQKLRLFYMDYDTVSGLIDVKEELASRFPELKESEDGLTWLTKYIEEEVCSLSMDIRDNEDRVKLKNLRESLAWLKKQGERKSADKVEPKFKVGDWVVWDGKISCHVDNIYRGKESLMYTIIDTNNMTRSYSVKGFDNNAHLWTIQDAKDGDVLQLGKVTAIFKELIDDVNCKCYCSVYEGEFEIPSQDGADNSYGCHDAIPATKEQRDALEKAMTDAGYTFDFKKKELKKIEQKPIEWHREDEQNLNACLGYIPDEYLRRWLTDAIRVEYDNPTWSEEDDNRINRLIAYFEDKESFTAEDDIVYSNWLKSLKDKYTCKPNEEQIKTCKEVYADILSAKGFDVCTVNNELNRLEGQLKKLTEKL